MNVFMEDRQEHPVGVQIQITEPWTGCSHLISY